jgi:DNA polymerase-1
MALKKLNWATAKAEIDIEMKSNIVNQGFETKAATPRFAGARESGLSFGLPINPSEKHYVVLTDIEQLPPYDTIALDTETTVSRSRPLGFAGLERNAKLLGVSFCGESGKAYWLPVDKIVPFVMEATLAGKQLIHNAKFDLQVLARNDIFLYGNPIFDTMIAHQLLDENERHGLKHLAKTVLGETVEMEKNPMIESPLLSSDASQLVEHACADADYHRTKSKVRVANTFQLYQRFAEQLKQENISRLHR